jgi:hypothetical protein
VRSFDLWHFAVVIACSMAVGYLNAAADAVQWTCLLRGASGASGGDSGLRRGLRRPSMTQIGYSFLQPNRRERERERERERTGNSSQ